MHDEYCRSLAFRLVQFVFAKLPLSLLIFDIYDPPRVGWCAALLLRNVIRPLCQISYWSRHRPVTIDILCSVGTVAFARFRCACLPPLWSCHNLEPSKLEGLSVSAAEMC